MKRILCIADNHWGDGSRAEECSRIHEWIVEQAATVLPDLIVDAGDIYDGPASPANVESASAWLQKLARHAPVVVTSGNHDRYLSIDHFRRLKAAHPIHAHERPGVVTVAGVAVAMLPWPAQGEMMAALGGVSQGEARTASSAALQAILRGLDAKLDEHPSLPRILLAHCTIAGSQTSTGQPMIGLEFELGLADLAIVRADAYVLGHIHCRQQFDVAGSPCFYSGSPYRRTYGEVETKGISLLELEPGQPARMTWIDSPAEELITLDAGSWVPGAELADVLTDDTPFCASFRVRYQVAAEHAASAAAKAALLRDSLLAHGANSVRVEPEVIVQNHARCPAITTRTTIADQLHTYWDQRDESAAVRSRLLGCLAQLEDS